MVVQGNFQLMPMMFQGYGEIYVRCGLRWERRFVLHFRWGFVMGLAFVSERHLSEFERNFINGKKTEGKIWQVF
jgi:hypothetical protein